MRRTIWIGCALSATFAVIVTALLLAPMTDDKPLPVPYLDKVLHAAMFFAVALPGMLVLPRRWHWPLWAVVIGYSGLTELVQPYFGRGAQMSDLAANAVGAALALIVVRKYRL